MVRLRAIEDLNDPALLPYRQMRQMTDAHGQGLFVAEGHKVVTRLLDTSLKIHSLLLSQEWLDRLRPVIEAREETIDTFLTTRDGIKSLTGFGCFQAIKALASTPQPCCLEDILQSTDHPLFLVALDGLTSADNVGSVVRNAVGFGADGLIVGPNCCPPYLRRAVHTSMGTIFQLPVHKARNLESTLRQLQQLGVRTIAAHPHARACLIDEVPLNESVCVVMGSEGEGLAPSVLEACQTSVMIPMAKGTDSLNVASASAVFFYELSRQRLSS